MKALGWRFKSVDVRLIRRAADAEISIGDYDLIDKLEHEEITRLGKTTP